jgi:hypothetical protein
MNTYAKRTVIVAVTIIVMIVAIIGASYAYLAASIGSAATTQINVISGTIDNLVFIPGTDLTVTANQDNFGSGSGDKSGTITSQVKLTANNYSSSTQYYRAYLLILENTFVYTSGTTPELKLTVKRGSTTVINNMDVTTQTGVIDIPVTSGGTAIKQSITASAGSTTTENWTATVTFVNLNSNQNANAGKHFVARLYVEESPMLPSGYQEVLYLQSSGTQYIDTGYYWQNENIEIKADVTVTSNSSSQSLFGNEEYTSSSNTRNFAGIPYGSNGTYSIYLGNGSQGSVSTTVGKRFKMDIRTTTDKNIKVFVNEVSKLDKTYSGSVLTKATAYLTSDTSTNVGHMFLFSNHNSNRGATNAGTQMVGGMRVYSFKMYDNNIMVRNLVPCVSGSAAGMYDTVNGVFYQNAGSGTFTYGGNVT